MNLASSGISCEHSCKVSQWDQSGRFRLWFIAALATSFHNHWYHLQCFAPKKKKTCLECLMSIFKWLSLSFFASLQQMCVVWSKTQPNLCSGVDKHPAWRCHFGCFYLSLLLRTVHRCRHRQFEAHQPHRKKCVFQSQDHCASQILRAP